MTEDALPDPVDRVGASSVRDFLKHYTDGDVGHGGRRYRCRECPPEKNGGSAPEFRDPFQARDHVKYTHDTDGLTLPDDFDFEATFDVLEVDADGRRVIE